MMMMPLLLPLPCRSYGELARHAYLRVAGMSGKARRVRQARSSAVRTSGALQMI
jgi:hypothetical protein